MSARLPVSATRPRNALELRRLSPGEREGSRSREGKYEAVGDPKELEREGGGTEGYVRLELAVAVPGVTPQL